MSAFTFRERKFTVALNVDGFLNKDGYRPNMDALVEFLRKDVEVDVSSICGIQWNDVMAQRTALIRFANDEKAAEFEDKLGQQGVPWTMCGGRRLGGWRCDGGVLVVKIMYVSYEVTLAEVRMELERYGEVKELDYSYLRSWSSTHKIRDGVIMARVRLNQGVKELPCWLRREATDERPAEVWRFQHRGQGEAGCWNCGATSHIGRRCKLPTFGVVPQWQGGWDRNNSFASAVRFAGRPQPQPQTQEGVEGQEGSVAREVEERRELVAREERAKEAGARVEREARELAERTAAVRVVEEAHARKLEAMGKEREELEARKVRGEVERLNEIEAEKKRVKELEKSKVDLEAISRGIKEARRRQSAQAEAVSAPASVRPPSVRPPSSQGGSSSGPSGKVAGMEGDVRASQGTQVSVTESEMARCVEDGELSQAGGTQDPSVKNGSQTSLSESVLAGMNSSWDGEAPPQSQVLPEGVSQVPFGVADGEDWGGDSQVEGGEFTLVGSKKEKRKRAGSKGEGGAGKRSVGARDPIHKETQDG